MPASTQAAGRAALPRPLRPGVSRDAGLAAIANDIKGFPNPVIVAAERPANVVSLASIADVPVAPSVLLALIAAGTLAHTLASSTRRRRHDLAILKSLGFMRRQVRHAVGWQATTIAATALLIGLPTGIAAGRWAWRLFAAQLGVLPEPAIPLTAILLAIPSALALANLIAAGPHRQRRTPGPLPSSGPNNKGRAHGTVWTCTGLKRTHTTYDQAPASHTNDRSNRTERRVGARSLPGSP